MTTDDARYSHSSPTHNRLLLLALVQAWGHKCYWCKTPTTFRGLQIDHIVPRNPASGPVGDLGLGADFDVDAAANLAPICGPCNQEKNNDEYWNIPRIASVIKAAADAVPRVQRHLTRFRANDSVVRALLAVTAADLGNDEVADSVAEFGAVILPVFRERFPQILDAPYWQDYTERRPVVEFEGRRVQLPEERSMIEWDVTSRRALVILEDVLDTPIVYALGCVRDEVRERVDDEVDHWIRYGTANRFRDTQAWQQPSSNPIGLYVRELRYVNGEVQITGDLEGTFTAHIEEDVEDREWWEPHTTSRYADFDFSGEFSATFSREEGITDASVYVSEPTENQWQYLDVLLEGDADADQLGD
ncbi:HNH endonuclease [Nocardia amamiensis]|uniref:HNH endonuclease n=1 Tax=Nocardia amamiensis TaxID=404578 RepID=A0ABS0D0J3_9NOCA|nr:HNH endonuclease signature motif containing protein [Nocardia amamiensis]MBF6302295.1 HNH endonuclease [Nocardia amamiensis]